MSKHDQAPLQDSRLSALLQHAAVETPAADLDQRIRQQARQAATATAPRASGPFPGAWQIPVSLAAVFVLSVSMVLLTQQQESPPQQDSEGLGYYPPRDDTAAPGDQSVAAQRQPSLDSDLTDERMDSRQIQPAPAAVEEARRQEKPARAPSPPPPGPSTGKLRHGSGVQVLDSKTMPTSEAAAGTTPNRSFSSPVQAGKPATRVGAKVPAMPAADGTFDLHRPPGSRSGFHAGSEALDDAAESVERDAGPEALESIQQLELEIIRRLWSQGDKQEALSRLRQFQRQHPEWNLDEFVNALPGLDNALMPGQFEIEAPQH